MNITLVEDTLILYGVGVDTPSLQQGITFVKLDTFGNILDFKFLTDSLGDKYILELRYQIIRTSDGGYAMVGNLHERNWGFLLKTNWQGDMLFFKEYPDPLVKNIHQRNILEINEGFLIGGFKQKSDFTNDIFILKTDKSGNKLWEKSYGQPGIQDFQGSLVKISDNEFIIGGSHQSPQNTPISQKWARAWLFAIDSLGEVLWEFEESENYVDAGVAGLNPAPDGGWIYCSGKTEIFSANDWGSRCQIVRRDSNFNLLWTRILSETSYSTNSMVDMKPMPDGTWAAVGRWSTPIVPGQSNYLGGSVHRLNDSGDTLWSKLFTAFPVSPNGSENYLGGLVVLPSGSIVAAGYTRRFAPPTTQYYGWVIKVNLDGCIDTLCVTSSASVPVKEEVEVVVYPNPASDEVTFDLQSFKGEENVQILVSNTSGQVVWSYIGTADNRNMVNWATTDLKSGIFFFRVAVGDFVGTGRIVLHK
ncbi:MAG: T9SS type A sorting domain-containing protein [Saprospiraceae bacterium]|nr:T9SS type A sorting domain-containing protein [Saprospiraceae bacterium]